MYQKPVFLPVIVILLALFSGCRGDSLNATNNNTSSRAEFQKSAKVNGTEDIAAIHRVDVPVKDHTVEAILATLAILILGVGACYCIHLYRREHERTQRRQIEPEQAKQVQLKTYTKVAPK
ncbi:unnamed protein product, partial [Mesorhabditis spiculigera]